MVGETLEVERKRRKMQDCDLGKDEEGVEEKVFARRLSTR